MADEIGIKISNRMRSIVDATGDSEYSTGTTSIEANTARDGMSVDIEIHKKGFGMRSGKITRVTIDIDAAKELAAFLEKHINLSERVKAMRAADGR